MTKAPMFWSVEAALSFAARVSNKPILKMSGVYAMRDKTPRATARAPLSPLDKHAQAAMIVRLAEDTLNDLELAYVAARYWRQVDEALPLLVPYSVAGLPTGIHNNRAVAAMVRNCFPPADPPIRKSPADPPVTAANPVPMRQIRGELRCRMADAVGYQKLVRRRFNDLHTLIMARLEAVMIEHGVIHEDDQ